MTDHSDSRPHVVDVGPKHVEWEVTERPEPLSAQEEADIDRVFNVPDHYRAARKTEAPSRSDHERLARAIHDGRITVTKHGRFTDRCICNDIARDILRGLDGMVPKPNVEKVIAEYTPAARPAEHEHSMWECGRMKHLESSHWMDETCSLPADDPDRCLFEPYRATRNDLRPVAARPAEGLDVERWARWIASQPRRTDWACSDCVEMDFGSGRAGREGSVVAGFRCVWHEAAKYVRLGADRTEEPRG